MELPADRHGAWRSTTRSSTAATRRCSRRSKSASTRSAGRSASSAAPLVGAERFLNDPFRLPEETNDPQADGTVNTVDVDNNGNGVLSDRESFHFNALYGERPGFDPRMNAVPVRVHLPRRPGAEEIPRRAVGVAGDPVDRPRRALRGQPADRSGRRRGRACRQPGPAAVRFSGTPVQSAVGLSATDLKWFEAVVSLGGAASNVETWTLNIDLDFDEVPDISLDYDVTPDGRALSKIVRAWAAPASEGGLNGLVVGNVDLLRRRPGRHRRQLQDPLQREAQHDRQRGRVPRRRRDQRRQRQLRRQRHAGPGLRQDLHHALDRGRLRGTADAGRRGRSGTCPWAARRPPATRWATGDAIADLTFNLADRIPAEFLPLVSGYTVTFAAPWPSEATSTVILSGAPQAGQTWSVSLDIAGTVKKFSHLVLAGETLEAISAALADAVNADPVGNLAAHATGVALKIVNVAGNTLATSFEIGPQASVVTPDPAQSFAQQPPALGHADRGRHLVADRQLRRRRRHRHQHPQLRRPGVGLAGRSGRRRWPRRSTPPAPASPPACRATRWSSRTRTSRASPPPRACPRRPARSARAAASPARWPRRRSRA